MPRPPRAGAQAPHVAEGPTSAGLDALRRRSATAPASELPDEARPRATYTDPLDPDARRCAQLGPPAFVAAPPVAPPQGANDEVAPRARVSMEELLPQLVKRIAWAGDRRRGSVQMELGAGPHAGAVVTVHAAEGRVHVELAGDAGGALRRRLEARGFDVSP